MDLVGGPGPGEGVAALVPALDEGADRGDELLDASKDPWRIARLVMMPKKTSTRFSQAPEVGVKCSVIRGCFVSQALISSCSNIRDFQPLLREWIGEDRQHAGVILIPSSARNEAFGALISGVQNTLARHAQDEWINRVAWLRRN